MARFNTAALLLVPLTLVSCSEATAPNGTGKAPVTISVPAFTRSGELSEDAAEFDKSASPPALADLDKGAKPKSDKPELDPAKPSSDTDAVPTSPPAPEPPAELPKVAIRNIGMHIGGGPNNRETKQPIRTAVQDHYDEMRACYAKAVKPKETTTFGIDLRIPAAGGEAKARNPRSGLKGRGVRQCMIEVFEQVEFPQPPRRRPTVVSYSVRFTRE